MNFNTIEFFLFLFAVCVIYWSLNHRLQNIFLLLASYLFFSFWDWRFLFLILLSTTTDFFCSLKIDQYDSRKQRRFFLYISLAVNLSILGIFKYFNFFVGNLIFLFQKFGLQIPDFALHFIVPIGISFFTLQSMSYTIDVYRQKIRPTKNFLDYALFVSFFPKLISGPIERTTHFLPQIQQSRLLTVEKLKNGFLLIYWGLFKKVVIADNLGTIISYFDSRSGTEMSGALIFVTTFAYAAQLYADFSGYTDIARGTAAIMGFSLTDNFRTPIFSQNIQDFWQRWHISLTSWFRDYVFLPLALMKVRIKFLRPYWAIFFTFLLVGMWHGANWNFLVWGAYNGIGLVFHHLWGKKRISKKKSALPEIFPIRKIFANFVTISFVMLGLVLFRAQNLTQAWQWITVLAGEFSLDSEAIALLFKIGVYFLILFVAEIFLFQNNNELGAFFRLPLLVRFGILYGMLFLMIVYHAPGRDFLYFQF